MDRRQRARSSREKEEETEIETTCCGSITGRSWSSEACAKYHGSVGAACEIRSGSAEERAIIYQVMPLSDDATAEKIGEAPIQSMPRSNRWSRGRHQGGARACTWRLTSARPCQINFRQRFCSSTGAKSLLALIFALLVGVSGLFSGTESAGTGGSRSPALCFEHPAQSDSPAPIAIY